ncbi:hypothetical protein DFJ73DRAFT_788272 [Zopfochytrium polystomum]|nr:hypothetical protein DFJ73DRAFT_788272 [Zopfochytrium polystomum]
MSSSSPSAHTGSTAVAVTMPATAPATLATSAAATAATQPGANSAASPSRPAAAAAQTPAATFHGGIHTIHHSQFVRTEPKEGPQLGAQVKRLMLEASPARLCEYEPEKVTIRTESRWMARDARTVAVERVRRRQDVFRDPTVDSDALLFQSLKIDPASVQRATHANEDEIQTKASSSRQSNGFNLIKSKLARSKQRLHAVKFGIPFLQVCDDEADATTQQSRVIDWANLKIDEEKQSYYTNLVEKHRANSADVGPVGSRYARTATHGRDGGRTKSPAASGPGFSHGRVDSTRRLSTGSAVTAKDSADHEKTGRTSGGPPPPPKTTLKRHSMRQLEDALGLPHNDILQETAEHFFGTRDKIYEQRQRLNQILAEDLGRMDAHRKPELIRKFHAFKLGTESAAPATSPASSHGSGCRSRSAGGRGGGGGSASAARRCSGARSAGASCASTRGTATLVAKVRAAAGPAAAAAAAAGAGGNNGVGGAAGGSGAGVAAAGAGGAVNGGGGGVGVGMGVGGGGVVLGAVAAHKGSKIRSTREAVSRKVAVGGGGGRVGGGGGDGAGAKGLTELEELLLNRIRCKIEDRQPFSQSALIQIMKLIPPSDFMNDEVQRIMRFVKVHEGISEREYLEAVELAGHVIEHV